MGKKMMRLDLISSKLCRLNPQNVILRRKKWPWTGTMAGTGSVMKLLEKREELLDGDLLGN